MALAQQVKNEHQITAADQNVANTDMHFLCTLILTVIIILIVITITIIMAITIAIATAIAIIILVH